MVSVVQSAPEDPVEFRRTLIPPAPGKVRDCSSLEAGPTRVYERSRHRLGTKHTSRSTVLTPLHHATCRPHLSIVGSVEHEAIQDSAVPTDVVKYLLQEGHDPNEGLFISAESVRKHKLARGSICISDGLDELNLGEEVLTTPHIRWLHYIDWPVPTDRSWDTDANFKLGHHRAVIKTPLVDAGAELGAPGTYIYRLVDHSLSLFICNAERSCGISVEWARSDDLWLKLRDKILSSRAVGSVEHKLSS